MRFYALNYPSDESQPELRGDEPSFDTPRAAWAWLKMARMHQENLHSDWNVSGYTDTVAWLDYAAGTEEYGSGKCEFGNPMEDWPLRADGTGRILGATPGLGDHAWEEGIGDLGVWYAVLAR